MKKICYSIPSKLLLHIILFISIIFMLISFIHTTSYLSRYTPEMTFYETYSFEERYSKYLERVAAYIQYCERGYRPDTSYIIDTNLPTDTYYFLEKRDSDQNTFEFYDKKLNKEKSNFIYYVKNTNTGTEYYSPLLIEHFRTSKNQTKESIIYNYCNDIKNAPTYFVLNTINGVYATNLTNWGTLSSKDVEWLVGCLTGRSFGENLLQVQQTNSSAIDLEDVTSIPDDNTQQDNYLVYTSILRDIPNNGDDFAPLYTTYLKNRNQYLQSIIILPISFIVFLITFFLTIVVCGHKGSTDVIVLNRMDKIFTELTLFIPLLGIFFLYVIVSSNTFGTWIWSISNTIDASSSLTPFAIIAIILYPWLAFWFYSCIRKLKAHQFLHGSFIYRFFAILVRNIIRFQEHAPITYHVAAYFLVFLVLDCLAFFSFIKVSSIMGLFFFLAALLFAAYFLFRYAGDYHIILKQTRQIAEGDLTHKLPDHTLSGSNKTLASYINHIGDGLSVAVDEKLKSERLKTELITNVSHDIKTPLTSIINYVDLLKKEGIENEKAKEYIQILESKSWRLKNLIEDLVEASKASSGAINLNLQKLNIIELVQQSAGEFEDRFQSRDLELVTNFPDSPVYTYADGRCTFRMIENIFSNAYKYAMEGTRIYIDIQIEKQFIDSSQQFQEFAILSVKNVSANKLNIPSSELMERFVRGDLARNTEGNGLGLSIVKSLSDLQNIGFDMFLDGDLFKTIFTFTLLKEQIPLS